MSSTRQINLFGNRCSSHRDSSVREGIYPWRLDFFFQNVIKGTERKLIFLPRRSAARQPVMECRNQATIHRRRVCRRWHIVSRPPDHCRSQKCALGQTAQHGWEISKIRNSQLRSFRIRAVDVLRVHGQSSGNGGQQGSFTGCPGIRYRHSADCFWAGVENAIPIERYWRYALYGDFDEVELNVILCRSDSLECHLRSFCCRYQAECETAVFPP